jgi:four helix bundle protein
MAKKLEELPVYQRALEFCRSVVVILEQPALRRDRRLRDQISAANDSITANMEEGFEQPTDASFANYLFIAKGSLGEVLGRLRRAQVRQYITAQELKERVDAGEELGRMLGGFIRYLSESNFKDRGRFKAKNAIRGKGVLPKAPTGVPCPDHITDSDPG